MAKTSGGVRSLGTRERAKENRKAYFDAMIGSGNFVNEHSNFNNKSGGYVLFEKGHNYFKDEVDCANILASKGYRVILNSENSPKRIGEGKLFEMSYEQRSPIGSTKENIRKAIVHAKEKNAKISVIYTSRDKHSRKAIEEGIKLYEEKNGYRFSKIIVVGRSGNVHVHRHNKK